MIQYLNLDRDSNVLAYEYGADWIVVQFADGAQYTYTSASAGYGKIARMKQLADVGRGLNGYINTHARSLYARRN